MQYTFICKNFECERYEKEFFIYANIGTLIVGEVTCPDCKTKKISRKWYSTPVHYHGTGFTKENKNDT
jgi:hypothetical protein